MIIVYGPGVLSEAEVEQQLSIVEFRSVRPDVEMTNIMRTPWVVSNPVNRTYLGSGSGKLGKKLVD